MDSLKSVLKSVLKSQKNHKNIFCVFLVLQTITSTILLWKALGTIDVYNNYKMFVPSNFRLIPNLFYALSIVILVIVVFECIAAIIDHSYMIFTLTITLAIVLGIQLGGALGGLHLAGNSEVFVKDELRLTMPLYNITLHRNIVSMWDSIQSTFECCGETSFQDWLDEIGAMPMSCCRPNPGAINKTTCSHMDSEFLFRTGCTKPVYAFISGYQNELGTVTIAFSILQLIGMAIVFGVYLWRRKHFNNHTEKIYAIDKKKSPLDHVQFI